MAIRYKNIGTQKKPRVKKDIQKKIDVSKISKSNSEKKSKIRGNKVIINLSKEIYDNEAYESFNKEFIELTKSEKEVKIDTVFDVYHELFDIIPDEGDLSHTTLYNQSKDYISNLYDPKEDELEELINEIEKAEQQLFQAQQPKKQHPFYRENTMLKLEGTPAFEVYIIQQGVKRKIMNELSFDTLKSNAGLAGLEDIHIYQLVSAEVLNAIPSGPDINTDVDLSIPLESFDEEEELFSTALVEIVDDFTIQTSEFTGYYELEYMSLTEDTAAYDGDKLLRLEPSRTYTLKTYALGGVQEYFPDLKSGFKSIIGYTNTAINDGLIIENGVGTRQNLDDILSDIDKSFYIPNNLESLKSLNLSNFYNDYEVRRKIKNNRDLGVFNGREVRTRVITPNSKFGKTDNADIQRIFDNPKSFYYKWEHTNFNGGLFANRLHLSDSNLYKSSNVKEGSPFRFLCYMSRIYGKPIYKFSIRDEDKGYWVLLNGKSITKGLNFLNLNGTRQIRYFLKLTSDDGGDILEARNPLSLEYDTSGGIIDEITTYEGNNILANNKTIKSLLEGEFTQGDLNITEVYNGFTHDIPYNAADKQVLGDIFN